MEKPQGLKALFSFVLFLFRIGGFYKKKAPFGPLLDPRMVSSLMPSVASGSYTHAT